MTLTLGNTLFLLALCPLLLLAGCAGTGGTFAVVAPADLDKDIFMGKYPGNLTLAGKDPVPATAIVVASGKGEYRVILESRINKKVIRIPLQGKTVMFPEPDQKKISHLDITGKPGGKAWEGSILAGELSISTRAESRDKDIFIGEKLEFTPPTLGAPPPAGAMVLLPFTPDQKVDKKLWNAEWDNASWVPMADGSMQVGRRATKSKRQLGSVHLHLEFMVPYMPKQRGQGRGNSGIYLQDRYEVQILDSFGLISKDNDCGGVYKIAPPRYNACLPPLRWQTYDITFWAPRFDDSGKHVLRNPRVRVVHNGLMIHKDLELPRSTGGGAQGFIKAGPIRLQDHHNPLRFRNIWAVELPDETSK